MKKEKIAKVSVLFVMLLTAAVSIAATGCSPTGPKTSPEAASADISIDQTEDDVAAVILHTNDVHCGFEENIGYDGLSLYKKELESEYDNVFLVDSGDSIQGAPIGSISKGQEITKFMNYVGYDVVTLGNHEFDFGVDALMDCVEAFDGTYVCANFCTSDGMPIFDASSVHASIEAHTHCSTPFVPTR